MLVSRRPGQPSVKVGGKTRSQPGPRGGSVGQLTRLSPTERSSLMPSNVYRISALEAKICLRTIGCISIRGRCRDATKSGEPAAGSFDETALIPSRRQCRRSDWVQRPRRPGGRSCSRPVCLGVVHVIPETVAEPEADGLGQVADSEGVGNVDEQRPVDVARNGGLR